MSEQRPTIIVRRVKKVAGGGHHGGSWKVAYADFVTAMMAFFLVMWLMGATTNKDRAAISEYFRNPSPLSGKSFSPAPGPNGPGGASTSMIKLGGTMDLPKGDSDEPFAKPPGQGEEASEEQQKAQEKQRLETLMQALQEAIGKSQALEPFKDQLLLDLTPEGLRIQIVDQQNRPMFDLGGTVLKPYTQAILAELAGFVNQVPNHISITGHTDTTQYASNRGYTNWELSAERANAARRALVIGGMQEDKVSRVVGLSSSVLFDKQNPQNPINRRISIVVMTKAAEEALQGEGNLLAPGAPLPDADTAMPDAPVEAVAESTSAPAMPATARDAVAP
ncbi:flagellar motor protein MotB [Pseudoxanthomonas sp. PXM02]|uniref:flagellar motor protein MotB n=1 Tax=Pseudoxanthomonas sp. PXM02 TaxID=2769294 RepID=UPI0017869A4D|nr:flagellar motor protein MotB [Pseudoxanthomonas sp. PXM02]MBD9480879.1 flagellar motor protein MotB [Pseudoxanthomonas sp. PXM02]